MKEREYLKEALWREFHETCMARLFIPHKCLGAPDLHEVFYTRAGLPKSKQGYIMDRHNFLTVCNHIHIPEATRAIFRKYAAMVLVGLYGEEAIKFYLDTAPFKTGHVDLYSILDSNPENLVEGWRQPDKALLASIARRIKQEGGL